MGVAFQAETAGLFKNPEALALIEKIQRTIEPIPGVDVSISFVDFIKDMNRAFHQGDQGYYAIPITRELIAQDLLLYDSDDIEDFVNYDFDRARISIRISEHNSSAKKRSSNR